MRILAEFDAKNYAAEWSVTRRCAARAVIVRNGKIALVRSRTEGFYKFPGGGVEPGEDCRRTLVRETLEEVGLRIIPESVSEFGMIREIRGSAYQTESTFEQLSYYYFAEVTDELLEQHLTDSERRLDYVLEWADIAHAAETDERIAASSPEYTFLCREAAALREIQKIMTKAPEED